MPQIYKLVLTGGPCSGKTITQARLVKFFESMGWKVFSVPELATILLSNGLKFAELTDYQIYLFEKNLLLILLQLEQTFFDLANLEKEKNVLIICDRGTMDPAAYIAKEQWDMILKECQLNSFDLCEQRYDHEPNLITTLPIILLVRKAWIKHEN